MQLLLDMIINSLEIVFLPQISLSFSSIFFYKASPTIELILSSNDINPYL